MYQIGKVSKAFARACLGVVSIASQVGCAGAGSSSRDQGVAAERTDSAPQVAQPNAAESGARVMQPIASSSRRAGEATPASAAGAGASGDADGGTRLAGAVGVDHKDAAAPSEDAAGAMQTADERDHSAYTFTQCPGTTPRADDGWSEFPACDGDVRCEAPAHCLPLERLRMRLSDELLDRIPDCTNGKCVPDEFAQATALRFIACNGELGDGRCIPQCFAIWTMPLSVVLETGAFGCSRREVCAPCTDPGNGEPTGLCEVDMCIGH